MTDLTGLSLRFYSQLLPAPNPTLMTSLVELELGQHMGVLYSIFLSSISRLPSHILMHISKFMGLSYLFKTLYHIDSYKYPANCLAMLCRLSTTITQRRRSMRISQGTSLENRLPTFCCRRSGGIHRCSSRYSGPCGRIFPNRQSQRPAHPRAWTMGSVTV
jgi:hypothetical protein